MQRDWLHTKLLEMVDQFVMSDMQDCLLQMNTNVANQMRTSCSVCGKHFHYHKALTSHEARVHGLQVAGACAGNVPEQGNDPVYNYGCALLALGLLLRGMDDAVHEGDGDRICRGWTCNGSHKICIYAALLLESQAVP